MLKMELFLKAIKIIYNLNKNMVETIDSTNIEIENISF